MLEPHEKQVFVLVELAPADSASFLEVWGVEGSLAIFHGLADHCYWSILDLMWYAT
jgi:hypothetical protein